MSKKSNIDVKGYKKRLTSMRKEVEELSEVTEEAIGGRLATAGLPEPDLLIRTGGEHRISNFLVWQAAYAELYFTDLYWPDFGEREFEEAVLAFQARVRKFGLTDDQITPKKV